MATHSSTLAWKIPWMEKPGNAAVHGVAKSWTRLSDFTFTFLFHALKKETEKKKKKKKERKRKRQPTPAFLPGESQGQGSLVGCHLWGRTESVTTEAT